MDYEKKYKEALEIIKGSIDTLNEIYKAGTDVVNIQSIKNCFYRAFPELEESDKEVDLNTAVADYIIKHTSEVSGYFDIRRIASHFFDLGLKAQKGD